MKMPVPAKRTETLRKLFDRIKIADINKLFQVLNTNSNMTVFRHLKKIGYFSSYSHAGRYYTLRHIPKFDANGLWQFQSVYFSKVGTLKETAKHILYSASAGMTHRELEILLDVRVHNTLRDMVKNNVISRERVGNVFLYISADKEEATLQISQRRKQIEEICQIRPLDLHATIEVLLELLRSEDWHPGTISDYLQAKGFTIRKAQVEEVLIKYNLKKKPRVD